MITLFVFAYGVILIWQRRLESLQSWRRHVTRVAMIRSIGFSALVVAPALIVVTFFRVPVAKDSSDESTSLTYLAHFEIENGAHGLSEPSGLALSKRGNALWTVSDNSNKAFQLRLDGELQKVTSFRIPDDGRNGIEFNLEGIALDPSGESLFMVSESENQIIQLNADTGEVSQRRSLSDMTGYKTVSRYFVNSPKNKGLEGIAWNADTGTLFVLKEGHPGLLIEVTSDFAAIRSHNVLSSKNGFVDDDALGDRLDFSGVCYDQRRKSFWMVSDKGQRLFLYDREANKVIQSLSLGYRRSGAYREIEKAEGVAIDPGSNRLFVVSDKEARLYVFEVGAQPANRTDRNGQRLASDATAN